MPFRHHLHRRDTLGFTLIETMVAALILSLVVGGTLGFVGTMGRISGGTKTITAATLARYQAYQLLETSSQCNTNIFRETGLDSANNPVRVSLVVSDLFNGAVHGSVLNSNLNQWISAAPIALAIGNDPSSMIYDLQTLPSGVTVHLSLSNSSVGEVLPYIQMGGGLKPRNETQRVVSSINLSVSGPNNTQSPTFHFPLTLQFDRMNPAQRFPLTYCAMDIAHMERLLANYFQFGTDAFGINPGRLYPPGTPGVPTQHSDWECMLAGGQVGMTAEGRACILANPDPMEGNDAFFVNFSNNACARLTTTLANGVVINNWRWTGYTSVIDNFERAQRCQGDITYATTGGWEMSNQYRDPDNPNNPSASYVEVDAAHAGSFNWPAGVGSFAATMALGYLSISAITGPLVIFAIIVGVLFGISNSSGGCNNHKQKLVGTIKAVACY